jgi:hypothetical protein
MKRVAVFRLVAIGFKRISSLVGTLSERERATPLSVIWGLA